MIGAAEPLAWRPRVPDPRQADLLAAALAASAYIPAAPMTKSTFPAGAVPAELPARIPLQVVTSTNEPPDGKGWLHEIKHDGHRLVAIIADGAVKLLSRNARDRTELFAEPFRGLAAAGLADMVRDRGAGLARRDAHRRAHRGDAPAPARAVRLIRLRSSPSRRPRSARLRDRGSQGIAARHR
jgi:hypothetical protein